MLETRHGSADVARNLFQQGIWSCAQSSGGQSGGRRCARLWQAWGVLEAREGDHAAARRCFSRSLDADKRNVAAVTAWTLMEQELGLFNDARYIFEREYLYWFILVFNLIFASLKTIILYRHEAVFLFPLIRLLTC